MTTPSRPDLPNQGLYFLLALVAVVFVFILYGFGRQSPGSPLAQWSATVGTFLLLAPLLFSILKRGALSDSPPFWFVTHVLSATLGICLILLHVAGGDWFSPPGLVLSIMLLLLLQGVLLRTTVSKKFSYLFARNSSSQGFTIPSTLDKAALATTIDNKIKCLGVLDANASEALFSPTLRHWLTRPILSFRYQSLADKESRIIGARQAAGRLLGWSRRIHLLAAALFYAGLLTHVIVVLFFAGYVAGSDPIDWWHVTDWGR